MNLRGFLLSAAAAAVFAAGAAQAEEPPSVSIPDTRFGIQIGAQFLLTSGTLSTVNESATGGIDPGGPYVTISGQGTGSQQPSAQASWGFEVTGPAGEVVPLRITGGYVADSSGSGIVAGGVILAPWNEGGIYLTNFNCNGGAAYAGSCGANTFSDAFNIATNTLYSITITVGGYLSSSISGSYFGSIDPLIGFDTAGNPDFDFSSLTLYTAPDAYPLGGVPEPDAWALMLLGFGGLGAALRARRRVAAALSARS